jgi:methyltransferase (TIGR00027 family)
MQPSDEDLATTARWTAAVRASESRRPGALFTDPWAEELAGDQGNTWLADRAGNPSTQAIVVRSRYFDDFLGRAVTEHGLSQVVILAAGLDTRTFRLSWPAGVRVYELDRSEVLEHKENVLARDGARPGCERVPLGQDLRGPWPSALVDSGFDVTVPSCWLLEGFLFYLPPEAISSVLRSVSELAAPDSMLGFDIVNTATLTHPVTRPWIDVQASLGAPWVGTMDDPTEQLRGIGWRAEVAQLGQEGASYGRWTTPVPPPEMTDLPHHWFVTARREREG